MEFVRNEVDTLYHEMVVDAMGAQSEYNDGPIAKEPNTKAREFYDLLHAAEVLIGARGQDVTVLSWMAEMLNMKTIYNMSTANWEMALSLSRKLLSPEDQEKVPKDFYSAKKMINVRGLGYKKIDICVNDCFWYYDEQSKNLTACPMCRESRYEPKNISAIRQKDVPRKSLWYLPITPRLQRLYMSRKATEHLTWHLKCREDADKVIHPTASEAWKHFDETHPTFVDEPRNVRLGLCTDGFNPFGCSTTPYSCWPVFLTVYNLPSELCMKSKHLFLAMIIAGPKSPRKNIDVMLRPLIDELKELWTNGELRFPDGYASNIARCVNMQELRLFGMKSHDCHVFMQRLLPIAFRDFLIDEVWGPLTEMSNFFRALTAPIIQVSNMEMWEEKIVETICKLEKVFPPAFFDSMEYLAIHLPYEAKVGGPVQFRWMYPFERKMHDLKKTMLNKNRVEASICESNILSGISFFCSHYFGSNIETRLNRQPRNIVGVNDDMDNCLSVFKHQGQPLGGEMPMRALSPKELKAAELYVLLNNEEVNPWIAYVL
ncbi:hypothetical protein SLEP1_g7626 [Rubroshorea leprosula]|uniref:DUF4218 domain-containing protein n=1 Tax=Rubroshorea leprosula TaxID=152421 RepID=A0AAV5I597_9ROSI|nr:hypothetical protein SLEP1_g7626 [Rubroshorea leprosula]